MKIPFLTKDPTKDILSGITVGLALVPEAVAFAFVAELPPLVGLYGAMIMGMITALFGGRPGMISGATGAMAIVMVDLVAEGNTVGEALNYPMLGLAWLLITLLFTGGIQIAAGLLKLGKYVRIIPYPVMLGFVNGLAIVIFLSQLEFFKEINSEGVADWMRGVPLYTMLGLVGLTMAIMYFLPKLTKAVPSALVAIIVVAGLSVGLDLEAQTVGSFIQEKGFQGMQGSLPTFQSGIFDGLATISGHWKTLIFTAVLLAAVGLIESLLTLNLVDELTESRGNGNKECIAQGVGNILSGLFGGMGGCAMIGQSVININSGGRGRLSGIIASLALLVFVVAGSQYIEQIPIAALVGVMFMVVIGTFAWSSVRILHKIPLKDTIVLIVVSVVTIWKDLAIAVFVGVIISALVFAWENATKIRARKSTKGDTKTYEILGPLFFGSVRAFQDKFDPKNDPKNVVIDFLESRVSDQSGMEALRGIANKYLDQGKQVTLRHLSPECKGLLLKANPKFSEVICTSKEDPRYFVAIDDLEETIS